MWFTNLACLPSPLLFAEVCPQVNGAALSVRRAAVSATKSTPTPLRLEHTWRLGLRAFSRSSAIDFDFSLMQLLEGRPAAAPKRSLRHVTAHRARYGAGKARPLSRRQATSLVAMNTPAPMMITLMTESADTRSFAPLLQSDTRSEPMTSVPGPSR